MSRLTACLSLVAAWLLSLSSAVAEVQHDPSGFRVDLPPGWSIANTKPDIVSIVGPDPNTIVQIEIVMQRTAGCASLLRERAEGLLPRLRGSDFEVSAIVPRTAISTYRLHDGAARGATMCAETSRKTGMYYTATVPAATYEEDWPRAVAVLKSFAFEHPPQPKDGTARPPIKMPQLVEWREPNELAYTMLVPAGWKIEGGIQRQDVSHYTDGVQATSPDGQSAVRLNDHNLFTCTIPKAGMGNLPGGYGAAGVRLCGFMAGDQLGLDYLRTKLARDQNWQDLKIDKDSPIPHPELEAKCQSSWSMLGGQARCSIAEIRFHARGGTIAGAILGKTVVFYAPYNDFMEGTLTPSQQSFWGPPDQFETLAHLTGAMAASQHVSPSWWADNNRRSQAEAEQLLDLLHTQAANSQEAFWDRMESSDYKREATNDVLGDRVRLTDGRGGYYEAPAGSNYYFYDEAAGPTAPRRDDPVRGTDVWPESTVDLRPLEVIR